jgi:hypothetical protein
MIDLLLYFILCFLAAIVVCAALLWLTRPAKVETVEDIREYQDFRAEFFAQAWRDMANDLTLARRYLANAPCRLEKMDNEDTRPLPAHKHDDIADSFSHEELWEAAANIPRESTAQKEQIDKWEQEAFRDAGEDWL